MTEPTLLPCPFCGGQFEWGDLSGLDIASISPPLQAERIAERLVRHPKGDCILSGQRWWGSKADLLNRRTPAAAALDAADARITGLEAMLADAQAEVERLRALADERFAEIKRAQGIINDLKAFRERVLTKEQP